MIWLAFLLSAAVVVAAADRLAAYSDVIVVRTGISSVLVGSVLLAAATSLPEFVAAVSAFSIGQPDLAVGGFLGSCMANMALLAILDLGTRARPLLKRAAVAHSLTGALATGMLGFVALALLADNRPTFGWLGLDSVVLVAMYFGGVWLLRRGVTRHRPVQVQAPAPGYPSLTAGVAGFAVAAAVLIPAVVVLVSSGDAIAESTGVGQTFVGVALLAAVTSLPEFVACWGALRLGSYDLAVGNLIGSNVVNMLGLGLADGFFTAGPLLGAVNPDFVYVALIGLLLTNMAVVGAIGRVELAVKGLEIDSLAILIVYIAGLVFLLGRGLAG